jgi:DNA damage-binding protein 1
MNAATANTMLERIATWNHNYLVTSLASRGDRILVGDAISSISVLRLEDDRLHLIARDYGALWPTSIELTSDSTLIGANVSRHRLLMLPLHLPSYAQSEYNLYTFSLQHSGTRQLLEKDGNYFLGDLVNKFLPGTRITYRAFPVLIFIRRTVVSGGFT